jgi:hypothetical protein
LGQNPAENGGLLLAAPNSTAHLPFTDCTRHRAISEPAGHRNPADPYFSASWGIINAHGNPAWINMPIWIAEGWYTNAWRNSTLFPTSTPSFRSPAARSFPDFDTNSLTFLSDIDETEILYHTDHRLAFVTPPLEHNVTLAGVPRITVEVSSDQPIGNLSAMIVDIAPDRINRNFATTNNNAYNNTIPGTPGIIGAWGARWDYNPRPAATANDDQAYIVSRSGTNLQNPNPPSRPIQLPDGTIIPGRAANQPGVTYLDTDIVIHTGMYAPFSWQSTAIQPGNFYSYTFTLEPTYYTFLEGHRLAVVVYGTHDHQTRSYIPANLTLRLGEGSFIYLPLLTELCIFDAADIAAAGQFLDDHAAALALTLANADGAVPLAAVIAVDEYDYNGYEYDYSADFGYTYQPEFSGMPFAADENEYEHIDAFATPLLTTTVYAEDWRETINIRFFLDGILSELPLEDIVFIIDGLEVVNIRDYTVNVADWQTSTSAVFINKLAHNWQHLTVRISAYGQTITKEFVNSMFVEPIVPVLTTTVYAEDWRETINIRFFLDDVLTALPLEDIVFIVDGVKVADIREYTVNIAGWQTSTSAVFINKLAHNWQYLTVHISAYGQTITKEFVNNMFVEETLPVLTTTIFAEEWRASINIRFFLDGVLTALPLEDIVLIADGVVVENIRDYTINIAGHQNAMNVIMISRAAGWQELTVQITAYDQTLTYKFIN